MEVLKKWSLALIEPSVGWPLAIVMVFLGIAAFIMTVAKADGMPDMAATPCQDSCELNADMLEWQADQAVLNDMIAKDDMCSADDCAGSILIIRDDTKRRILYLFVTTVATEDPRREIDLAGAKNILASGATTWLVRPDHQHYAVLKEKHFEDLSLH